MEDLSPLASSPCPHIGTPSQINTGKGLSFGAIFSIRNRYEMAKARIPESS